VTLRLLCALVTLASCKRPAVAPPPARAIDGDLLGGAVAVAGDRMIVGAPGAGRIVIRERDGDWFTAARFAGGKRFGEKVAIADSVAVAAGDEARVYVRTPRSWRERAASDDWSDSAVAVAGRQVLLVAWDGERAVLRIADLDLHILQEIELPDWVALSVVSLAADGDRAVVGAPRAHGRGAAILYEREGAGRWSQRATWTGGAWFGVSVALDGDQLAIGDRDANRGAGQVRLFRRDPDGRWSPVRSLSPPGGVLGFGIAVALRGPRLAVLSLWDPAEEPDDRLFVYDEARRLSAIHVRPWGLAGGLALDGEHDEIWLGVWPGDPDAGGDGALVAVDAGGTLAAWLDARAVGL
jgi:hypothetical protein